MQKINKIYLINLPHQSERLERLQGLLKEENLNIPVEIFEGTFWKDTKFQEMLETGKLKGSKHWKDWFNPYSEEGRGQGKSAENDLNLGDIACCYTHLRLFKKILGRKETALILEDDCYWSKAGTLKKAIDDYHDLILQHNDFGICYLGREQVFDKAELPEKPYKNTEFLELEYSWCTHAFIVSDEACRDILSQDIHNNMLPIDEYMAICWGKSIYLRDNFAQYNENLAKTFKPVTKAISYKDYESIYQGDETCLRGLGKSEFVDFTDSDIHNSGEYNG